MKGWMHKCLLVFSRFRMSRRSLLLVLLAALIVVAVVDFSVGGLARRTFVFYAAGSGAVVEERMLKVFSGASSGIQASPGYSREVDITRYVEEALLGPVSPDSMPLFPKETRLRSLQYRDGTVYVDLSEDAALPPLESAVLLGGDVFIALETLYSGIKRNFPFVREARFFIDGNAAYAGKFR